MDIEVEDGLRRYLLISNYQCSMINWQTMCKVDVFLYKKMREERKDGDNG